MSDLLKNQTPHQSVMLDEVLASLESVAMSHPDRAKLHLLDCTLGFAGHSDAILSADPRWNLVGFDRDTQALSYAQQRLRSFAGRVSLVNDNFANALVRLQGSAGIFPWGDFDGFDAILLDLGVSSFQLDEPQRGFSFQECGPLDMRMDLAQQLTASDVVNGYSPRDLKKVLQRGGFNQGAMRSLAKNIADEIVSRRPLTSTSDLARICSDLGSRGRPNANKNPSTVVFQAVRMEVNQELQSLEKFLDDLPELLRPQGRLVCISFHSLEDQVVASVLRKLSMPDPVMIPLPGAPQTWGKLITKKSIKPSVDEISKNRRSRSAMLRIFDRLDVADNLN